jgi:hypothetical protein
MKEFADRFIEIFLRSYPEWKTFINKYDDELTKIFVPAPKQKDSDDFLWITIENDEEVTVGFDDFHGHYYSYCYASENDCFEKLFLDLKCLVDETKVIATVLHADINRTYDELIDLADIRKGQQKVLKVRSWKGTYDQLG